MSSLFDLPGQLVKSSTTQTSKSTILYVILILVVVVIAYMLMNKKIDLSWLDIRPRHKVIEKEAERVWIPSANNRNLVAYAETHLKRTYRNSDFTSTMEVILYDTRTSNTSQYRHLYHRGSNDLAPPSKPGETPPFPEFGLPKRMNPGIFLDPYNNDIIVFVDTMGGSEVHRESVRIKDIPLDTPFRLGITLEGRVLEVYINCKLEVTKVLSNPPRVVENDWYGVAGRHAGKAQIQNLLLWNRPLKVNEIGKLCKEKPKFDFKPSCDVPEA